MALQNDGLQKEVVIRQDQEKQLENIQINI